MRLNWIVIPLITIAVAVAGSMLTSNGLETWYDTIRKPSFTPPGSVIGAVWTILYILATISALIFWNSHAPFGGVQRDSRFWWITTIFIVNAVLNVLWSLIFFNLHQIYAAFWEAVILGLSVVALVVMIWPISIWASVLLAPYAVWVAFASYLTYSVWVLNR